MSPARVRRIHFVGIGGTGMSGLAEVLLTMKYEVSGSDLARTEVTERLAALGARVDLGHAARNVAGADLLVFSSAVPRDNPEVREARRLGLPMLKRGEMLAEIMRLRYGIAVAGAHGKTTTTSLTGHLLARAGLDPTVVVGGRLKMLGGNARLGASRYLVAEADESDGSFLELNPTIAVVTNVDREHLDHYRGLADIRRAFQKFMRQVPFYGLSIVCGDDPNVRLILGKMRKRVLTYGFGEGNVLRAVGVEPRGLEQRFLVQYHGRTLGEAVLSLPGRHNVLNALAAIAVGLELEIPELECLRALEGFEGVGRRFELKGEGNGVRVIDDYGHHPTEVAAVLATARSIHSGRLVVIFQPHRYSRTQALAREFAEVLRSVDLLILADVYAAGEKPIHGVGSDLIVDQLQGFSDRQVIRVKDKAEALARVPAMLLPGDLVLTLGAGDITRWGEPLLARYLDPNAPVGETGSPGDAHHDMTPRTGGSVTEEPAPADRTSAMASPAPPHAALDIGAEGPIHA
ncbi:MAG: UDP-N-acetylmuramate--L-alanine ligase [Candidatus Eisenbacteria bacterium]|nr:UDP-N-acetylmuramate--L-alanine ligase [Candidatus Eisenbacteria bacterium]MCC7144096.1 UDP-N-acetylmuramate--L-alanine ligase [Candidatus Eisenbacteria bacterium]